MVWGFVKQRCNVSHGWEGEKLTREGVDCRLDPDCQGIDWRVEKLTRGRVIRNGSMIDYERD